jgi:hypothetical protein
MRMSSSFFALSTVVYGKQIERLTDRMWLLRIERVLEAALDTAERVLLVRVFLADNIKRQLVVFDEPHARSLPRWRAA